MPSCRMPRSDTQATLRLSELQHATSPRGGHGGGDMQAWLLRTLSWLPGDSTTSPTAAGVLAAPSDTMPGCRMPRSVKQATLRLSELQHAAARNKPSWRPSLRRYATSVAQRVVMAVLHVSHVSRHRRTAASTVGHDAKPRYIVLSAVLAIRRTTSCTTQQAIVAAIVEAAWHLCCSAPCHGRPARRPRQPPS